MKRAADKVVPATIDDYLANLPAHQRAALQKLRATIRSAAPGAEECISYGLPTFRLKGKPLIYFGAAATHCALYGAVDATLKKELAEFDASGKGTIRFTPEHPIPATLVRKLVKARLAKLEAPRTTSATKTAKQTTKKAAK